MPSKKHMTVANVFNRNEEIRSYKEDDMWVLPGCMIGVEIELEGVRERFKFKGPAYWEEKQDGSLRDIDSHLSSTELVFSLPLCGYDLKRALLAFDTCMKEVAVRPKTSPRCSVHVHIDVRDLNMSKLLNLLVIYTIVERMLYKFCGEGREDSNFCIPFYKGESRIFEYLSAHDMLNEADGLIDAASSERRYSGLNVCSLKRYGSLEFRQFPATLDINKIMLWINIIMSIKKAALEYKNELTELPKSFSEEGIEKKVSGIFGNYFQYLKYPELEYDVLQGIRQAQDILYAKRMEATDVEINNRKDEVPSPFYTKLIQKLGIKEKKKAEKEKIAPYKGPYQSFFSTNPNPPETLIGTAPSSTLGGEVVIQVPPPAGELFAFSEEALVFDHYAEFDDWPDWNFGSNIGIGTIWIDYRPVVNKYTITGDDLHIETRSATVIYTYKLNYDDESISVSRRRI